MARIYKVLAGIPSQGTTIGRQMKAVKKATLINTTIAASTGVGIAAGAAMINSILAAICGVGFMGGNLNLVQNIRDYKALKPKFDSIRERAKQIYKK